MTTTSHIHVLQFGQTGQLASELLRVPEQQELIITAVPKSEVDFSVPAAVARRIAEEDCVDVVVNAVAYTAVDKAESEIDLADSVNAIAPGLMAEACAQRGIPLVHVSTDYVFDGYKSTPYVETDAIAPLNIYGRTKCRGEDLIRAAWPQHVILRSSWIYSSRGTNFVKTILKLASVRDEIRVVDDQWGNPTAASDLALAILEIVKRVCNFPSAQDWGTFHYAGLGSTNWSAFAQAILNEAGKFKPVKARIAPIPSVEYPTAAARPKYSMLECSKLRAVYGISPRPWPEAMKPVVHELVGTM